MKAYLRWFAILLVFVLAACGQSQTAAPPAAEQAEADYAAVVAASELVVGPNRLPIGVLKDGSPVNDPALTLHLRFFYLDGDDSTAVQAETDALYRGEGLPLGLYVAYTEFDRPGGWGVEVQIPRSDGEPQVQRLRLDVAAESRLPNVGDAAIPSTTLTAADVPELAQLTSDAAPDPDLYQLSVADALAAQQPFLVTFSTPGYCQTAVCAPNLEVIKDLKDEFQPQVNFIHVEVYPYPFGDSFAARELVPAMAEWRLRTEPWTFLVDTEGVIQARFEGGLTYAELRPALERLAAGEPVLTEQ